jgi:hypothetical protein
MLDAGCWMLDTGCWMLDEMMWVGGGFRIENQISRTPTMTVIEETPTCQRSITVTKERLQ